MFLMNEPHAKQYNKAKLLYCELRKEVFRILAVPEVGYWGAF